MIEMHRAQRSFGDGLIAEEVDDLREDWMKYADWILDDEFLRRLPTQKLGWTDACVGHPEVRLDMEFSV